MTRSFSADPPRVPRLGSGLVLLLATMVPLMRVLWHWDAAWRGATCEVGVQPGCATGQGLAEWWATVCLLGAGLLIWLWGSARAEADPARGGRALWAGATCCVLALVLGLVAPAVASSLPAGWLMTP